MTLVPCPTCDGIGWATIKGRLKPCGRCAAKGLIPESKVHAAPKTPIDPDRKYKIAIVGEAWGDEEARIAMPFVGASGQELTRMLDEADIAREDCFLTNVFNLQPPSGAFPKNDVKNLCVPKKQSNVPLGFLQKNQYLQDQYYPEVERLWQELKEVQPNVIIALGSTAVWALTGEPGIKKVRGTAMPASLCNGIKVFPTYHPAAVLRDWSIRPVVVADLQKAKRESEFPEIRRPRRELWIEPALNHIQLFYEQYVLRGCHKLSFDIETAGSTQITCVGFAPSPTRAIVVPFVDVRKSDGSYWPTAAEEKEAWLWVRKYMQTPELDPESIRRLGQNTLYDINWLWHWLGFTPRNYREDTMLKHHAMQPEFEKSLGFLGSIYTDEPAWKLMRGKGAGTIKRGE